LKRSNLIINSIWIVFSLAVCLESWRLDAGSLHAPGPGFLPFITGLLLGILAVIAFIQALREKPSQDKSFLSFGNYLIKVGVLAGALIVYVLLLNTLGFLVGTFLLLLFLFRIMEPLGWKTVFLASLITLAAVYLLFDVFLGTRLPTGILGIG
jgi:putative tricarboxylic transport membrane protein